jgi:hypothetical protein
VDGDTAGRIAAAAAVAPLERRKIARRCRPRRVPQHTAPSPPSAALLSSLLSGWPRRAPRVRRPRPTAVLGEHGAIVILAERDAVIVLAWWPSSSSVALSPCSPPHNRGKRERIRAKTKHRRQKEERHRWFWAEAQIGNECSRRNDTQPSDLQRAT